MGFHDAPGSKRTQVQRNEELYNKPQKAEEYARLVESAMKEGMEMDQAIEYFDELIALAESESVSHRMLAELKMMGYILIHLLSTPTKNQRLENRRLNRLAMRLEAIEDTSPHSKLARLKDMGGIE